jgi:2'-5' RNA ligase
MSQLKPGLQTTQKSERRTDRLFFATFPPASAAEACRVAARQIQQQQRASGNIIAAERLHISLFFVGDFSKLPEVIVERAKQAAAQVRVPPFEIELNRAHRFSGSRACVLLPNHGIEPLAALHHALWENLIHQGIADDRRTAFTPHLTLFYPPEPVRDTTIQPIAWKVQNFALIHSLIGKGVYRTLGTFTPSDDQSLR